jgi:hypothetical protein
LLIKPILIVKQLDGNVLLVTMDDKRRNCGVILKLRNPELQLEFHCLTAFLETSLYDSLVSFMDPSAKKKKGTHPSFGSSLKPSREEILP